MRLLWFCRATCEDVSVVVDSNLVASCTLLDCSFQTAFVVDILSITACDDITICNTCFFNYSLFQQQYAINCFLPCMAGSTALNRDERLKFGIFGVTGVA